MTLEEFIAARLDEDERIALEANGGRPWHAIDLAEEGIGIYDGEDDGDPDAGYSYSPPRTSETRHITRHDPARVLRQAPVLRAVVELIKGMPSVTQQIEAENAVLYPLAAIWDKHPDYRAEWRATP